MKINIEINPVVFRESEYSYYAEVAIRHNDIISNRTIKKESMRPMAYMVASKAVMELEKKITDSITPVIEQCLKEFCSQYPAAKE